MNTTKKEYSNVQVKQKIRLNKCYFLLETENHQTSPSAGQFYLLRPEREQNSILHIPVSIFDRTENELRFLIKIVGVGTEALGELITGDRLKILGPLGNGFKITEGKKTLLVSGGIGYAPLYLLKKELMYAGNQVVCLHGGRTTEDTFEADLTCTEDGSSGLKGMVTEYLLKFLEENAKSREQQFDMIYCCGPEKMMQAVYLLASRFDIPVQVSLEEYMACGMGVCLGCAVKVRTDEEKKEYKTVCNDGPVFPANKVVWDE
jgi:dihydroorotate dehydrogenase electron transfer subunit